MNTPNSAWIFLLLASVMEVCWNYCLKYASLVRLRELGWARLFTEPAGWWALLPAVGYVAFGVGNVFFFSKALTHIPAATAFAIWMGMALVGIKLVDTLVLREPFSLSHVFYIGLILVGIVGLKRSA